MPSATRASPSPPRALGVAEVHVAVSEARLRFADVLGAVAVGWPPSGVPPSLW
jgi:hypothetical protein